MVPEGWATDELGKLLLDIKGGGTPSKKNPAFWGGDIPWASVKDITKDRHTKTEDYITLEGLKDSASNLIPADTIIIATRMAVGKAVRFSCDVAINQDLKAVFPDPKLSPDFLFFWFNAHEKAISDLASGSTVLGIRLESLRAMKILLPPIHEQKKIAVILGSVDATIESTQTIIKQTKKVKQGLLQTLLTRGIGHTKYKSSPLGEIPEGWEIKTLEELATVERGKFSVRPRNDPRYFEGKWPFIQTGDVARSDGVIRNYGQTLNDSGLSVSRLFSKGTIVLTIAANIGDVAVISFDAAFPDSLVGISAKPTTHNMWLFYALKTQKEYLESKATQNAQKNINLQILRPMPIACPPLDEQKMIAKVFEEIDEQINAEVAKLASLQQLKKGLMDDLLTGRVRVANVPRLQLVHSSQEAAPVHKVQPAFKRAVLAAEITYQLYQNPKFGSVKQEKIIDLCERHLDLDADLDRHAYRHAAGPYDNKAKRSIETNFKSHKWFDVQRVKGQGVKYRPLTKCGGHKTYFDRYFGHVSADIQAIINLLTTMDTEQCEIVATLYAAWNDFLLKGQTPDDETIVNDVLNNWHDNKRKIEKGRWLSALSWMRQKHLVPHGGGRQTKATKP